LTPSEGDARFNAQKMSEILIAESPRDWSAKLAVGVDAIKLVIASYASAKKTKSKAAAKSAKSAKAMRDSAAASTSLGPTSD